MSILFVEVGSITNTSSPPSTEVLCFPIIKVLIPDHQAITIHSCDLVTLVKKIFQIIDVLIYWLYVYVMSMSHGPSLSKWSQEGRVPLGHRPKTSSNGEKLVLSSFLNKQTILPEDNYFCHVAGGVQTSVTWV